MLGSAPFGRTTPSMSGRRPDALHTAVGVDRAAPPGSRVAGPSSTIPSASYLLGNPCGRRPGPVGQALQRSALPSLRWGAGPAVRDVDEARLFGAHPGDGSKLRRAGNGLHLLAIERPDEQPVRADPAATSVVTQPGPGGSSAPGGVGSVASPPSQELGEAGEPGRGSPVLETARPHPPQRRRVRGRRHRQRSPARGVIRRRRRPARPRRRPPLPQVLTDPAVVRVRQCCQGTTVTGQRAVAHQPAASDPTSRVPGDSDAPTTTSSAALSGDPGQFGERVAVGDDELGGDADTGCGLAWASPAA